MKRKIFLAKTMQFNSVFALRNTVRLPGPDKGELYRIAQLFTYCNSTCKFKTANGRVYMYRTFFELQLTHKRRRLTQNFSLHRMIITPPVIVFKTLKFLYRTMPINLKSGTTTLCALSCTKGIFAQAITHCSSQHPQYEKNDHIILA